MHIFEKNIKDLDIEIPIIGSLRRWASQGVLLLNSVLTVSENTPESHKNMGWEVFTDTIVKYISENTT